METIEKTSKQAKKVKAQAKVETTQAKKVKAQAKKVKAQNKVEVIEVVTEKTKTIKENLTLVAQNKSVIKTLRIENNQLLRDVIKESINQFKELKNDNFFKGVEKRKLIEVLKVRNEAKSDLFSPSFDYIELNISINLNEVSPSLFKDLVNLTKNGFISKNSFKSDLVLTNYLLLRKNGKDEKDKLSKA